VCLRPVADHLPARLHALGFNAHEYDPGERRASEGTARAVEPTTIVAGREPRVHHASPGPDRWKERSRTLQGIAGAMADQWGSL
jgi:hypothetical protein